MQHIFIQRAIKAENLFWILLSFGLLSFAPQEWSHLCPVERQQGTRWDLKARAASHVFQIIVPTKTAISGSPMISPCSEDFEEQFPKISALSINLYTLQVSISKPMNMTNSKRHALDGRTYQEFSTFSTMIPTASAWQLNFPSSGTQALGRL